jgi:hypothetical protein
VIEDLINATVNRVGLHHILNVAGEAPRTMGTLIQICEASGIPINILNGEINSLDVSLTHGSSQKLSSWGVRTPKTSLEVGIGRTAEWMSYASKSELIEFLD